MNPTKVRFEDREVVLPFKEATGAEIKQQLGIAANCHLAVRTSDGPKLVANHEKVALSEGTALTDVPQHVYGST